MKNGSEVGFQGCVGNLDPGLGKLNLSGYVLVIEAAMIVSKYVEILKNTSVKLW